MTTDHQYLAVCPRGFTNEIIYLRVPLDKVDEVERHFAHYEDDEPGRWCSWTDDARAKEPWTAVDWANRHYVGL